MGAQWPVLPGARGADLAHPDAYTDAEQAATPGTWLTVRYEDVLAKPRQHFERILAHVGLSWSARFEVGLRRHRPRSPQSERFHRDLDARDLTAIEEVLKRVLHQHGYL